MKGYFLLLTSFLFSLPLFSQQTISGKIIDQTSQQPIPWVNIGIPNQALGTVSSEDGSFSLPYVKLEDEVVISCLGFETQTLTIEQLQQQTTIPLKEKPYTSPAVLVEAKPIGPTTILGGKIDKKKRSVGFGSNELGAQIGAHIKIKKETVLQSAHFTINHAQGDSVLYRVNIYTFQKGRIGESLLPSNLLIHTKQKRGTIDVDLSDLNLTVQQDILLALEWIKDDNGKGNVGLTFRARKSGSKNNFWMKKTSQAPWQKASALHAMVPKMQLGFYVVGKEVLE